MSKIKNPFFFLLSFSPSPSPSLPKTPRKPSSPSPLSPFPLFLLLLLLLCFTFFLLSLTNSKIAAGDPPPPMAMTPLPPHSIPGSNLTAGELDFWRQPEGLGYRPCLRFSLGYRRASAAIAGESRRFIVAAVSGGLNQQRRQIVDAVVIARILGAAMVVPELKLNPIWKDKSKFSDIFDVDHFIGTLRSDVNVVRSLPSDRLDRRSRHGVESSLPFDASPLWIRAKFHKQLRKNGVLVLKGLDSKLSKDLPLDLQKLRCKVAFHALRFASPVLELGEKLASRMWEGGPFVAVHLRMERDVWVRTGCLPGLSPELDDLVLRELRYRPEFLTDRHNFSEHRRRRIAGLCPLNSGQLARLLVALGAPAAARMYVAGGRPLGGIGALAPLAAEFQNLHTKETIATAGELAAFTSRPSIMAAVDFIVAMSSDVFVSSHGGNFHHTMQGVRAYAGHRKTLRPNKRALAGLPEKGEEVALRRAHAAADGRPEDRRRKKGRDVVAFPVPECMCSSLQLF